MIKKQDKGTQEMTAHAMAQICSFLKRAQPNDTNLRESLRVISEYLNVSGSALLRLRYNDKTEGCQIEKIGSWPSEDTHALSLDSVRSGSTTNTSNWRG